MNIIEDVKIYRPLMAEAIKKYGYVPEHHLDWFEYSTEQGQQPIYISWPDTTGLLTYRDIKEEEWYVLVEPLAPKKEAGEKIVEFATYALSNSNIKDVIIVDVSENTKLQVENRLPYSLVKLPDSYTLIWPIMDMKKFDPELTGSHFKSIRNAKRRFFRDHNLKIIDAIGIEKKSLHKLVDNWSAKRTGNDESWPQTYHNLIDNNFRGMISARALIADNAPTGINTGWEIPNSNRYYYGVGIHDYSIRDFGIIMYLENLEWIKNAGYFEADMGGVETESEIFFKNRFLPKSSYKTYSFSIVKK